MLRLVVTLLFVAAVSASVQEEWEAFKAKYEKDYGSDKEEQKRFTIFSANFDGVEKHNKLYDAGKSTFQLGINQFADLTVTEFSKMMNGYRGVKTGEGIPFEVPEEEPEASVDWRTKGAVTPIKNQAQCGSCWAFSTTGSLEGQHFLKTGKLVSLSEQNLVDCSGKFGNYGCNGGLMDNGFEYIKENKGIDTEASYPYEAEDDSCRYKTDTIGATCKGFVDIPSGNEAALTKAISKIGPISVAIDASNFSFQMYKKGIYYEPDCSSEALDHGVLAVGYGSQKKKDYYLVKNSWGTDWGMDGYIHMTRNRNNNCGIATQASYPTV
ncbi:procathepsin L-like [Oratosquilla oratoria]|uniref:procathepsin L-like n=1 Tax=Oratosquilla oratoria TaxID=337810 RepID=UPI003F75D4C5